MKRHATAMRVAIAYAIAKIMNHAGGIAILRVTSRSALWEWGRSKASLPLAIQPSKSTIRFNLSAPNWPTRSFTVSSASRTAGSPAAFGFSGGET
jgi:hypothetical protein